MKNIWGDRISSRFLLSVQVHIALPCQSWTQSQKAGLNFSGMVEHYPFFSIYLSKYLYHCFISTFSYILLCLHLSSFGCPYPKLLTCYVVSTGRLILLSLNTRTQVEFSYRQAFLLI